VDCRNAIKRLENIRCREMNSNIGRLKGGVKIQDGDGDRAADLVS
jgi:hypothetical protein